MRLIQVTLEFNKQIKGHLNQTISNKTLRIMATLRCLQYYHSLTSVTFGKQTVHGKFRQLFALIRIIYFIYVKTVNLRRRDGNFNHITHIHKTIK